MDKDELLTLAKNPDFVSGIYNYCDRWCERCPLTMRCFLYATQEPDADFANREFHDINNEKFWMKLRSIFESTAEMLREWAAESGVDLDSLDTLEAAEEHKQEMERVEHDELTQGARLYSVAVEDWFKTELETATNFFDDTTASDRGKADLQISDAIEVIRWYQFFVAVKVMRALTGIDQIDEEAFDDEEVLSFDFTTDLSDSEDEVDYDAVIAKSSLMDSNGSAKIALVSIDRSIAAWRVLQISLPEKSDAIKPLLMQLERLRRALELRFPRARDFVRPGFDEHLSEFVS